MTTHTHYFRKVGGQWICADETCLMPVAAIASHAEDCTLDHPCPECAADLELLGGYPDPYAAIAAKPKCPNCDGTGQVTCRVQSHSSESCWGCRGVGWTPCGFVGCGASS